MNETETVASQAAAQQTGFLDSVKEKVDINQIVEKVQESRNMLIEIAVYGGIGFLTGFLVKKYSNAMIVVILMTTALVVLQQFDFIAIAINWNKVHEVVGLQPAAKIITDNFGVLAVEWAKANLVIVVSSIIGFLLGIKVA